ncbi:DUF6378 domain-containing protein [Seminibacterium arietis]|uniref:DUF6378 domain-containing protein n=1 Tax=Seminibacterium arietis TaxID=1173502 RepID=A0ABW3I7M5_9PAST
MTGNGTAGYGSYDTFAQIYGDLREVIEPQAQKLNWQQRTSIEMILFKITRILNKGATHQDNWQDIAGYALLALLGGDLHNSTKK